MSEAWVLEGKCELKAPIGMPIPESDFGRSEGDCAGDAGGSLPEKEFAVMIALMSAWTA